MKEGVSAYTTEGEPIVTFYSAKREGDRLIVDVKVLDSMRMDIVFTVKEVFGGLKLALSWPVISFILLVPFFALKQCFCRKKAETGNNTTL
jgi:hypothetical protein